MGGFAFDVRGGGIDLEAADVIQTSAEHFYSPLFPTDLLEKPIDSLQAREYYRHFYRRDPYVGRSIDLHCDLPISKIRLKLPDTKDKNRARKILKFYEEMCRRLRLQKRFRDIALEYWLMGVAHIFHEWDDEQKVWRNLTTLNPDALEVENYPYTDFTRVSIKPSNEDSLLLQQARANPEDENLQRAIEDIPEDILARVESGENIPLDTDPYEGSFVYSFARRKLSSDMQGVSILERVMDTLIYRDKLRQAQSMIASRSMTPKNLVWAEGLSDPDINDLREQVDLAIADPDFSIVANYQLTWEQIGAEGRLLDLATEYDYTETLLTVGLGVTRELLTGEGSFTGNRIGLEIMNTSYMALRDDFIEYAEEFLFRPVAVANDFYEEDADGNRVYLYPRLTFTRLALRDNVDTFDMLFNLYQKGSIDISVILDLLNIDAADTKDRLERDLFTVNDSSYNELIRGIYTEVARSLVERTDIADRIARSLKLKVMKDLDGELQSTPPIGGGPPAEGGPEGEEGAPPEGEEGAPGGEEAPPPEAGGGEEAPSEGGGGEGGGGAPPPPSGPPPPPGGGGGEASVRRVSAPSPRTQNSPNRPTLVVAARKVNNSVVLAKDGMRTKNTESQPQKIVRSNRAWRI